MYPSEPFPHFVDDYLAYLQEAHPTHASLDGVHVHDDLLDDLSRTALDNHVRALAGFSRRLSQIDATLLTAIEQVDHRDRGRQHRRADPRRRRRACVGPEPTAVRRPARHEPRVTGALRLRARSRTRTADGVEAASGASPRAVGDGQHQGSTRYLRQDRPRNLARRAVLHRARPAQGVLTARRPAHPRRPGGHVHRRRRGGVALHPVSRRRPRTEGQGVVPARARDASSRS